MHEVTHIQSYESQLNKILTSKSNTKYPPVPPPPKLPRPDSPRRPNQASPRDENEKKANPYSMFMGELDSYSDELLAWVSRRCPQDAWDRLKSRSNEPGSPPWLNGEALGLDPLSHKVLALSVAHCICAHSTVEDGPFPRAEDMTASQAMYKLALLPPKGIYDLANVLSEEAPLRKLGLIEVNENLSPRRRRFERSGISISRFFGIAFSLNIHSLAAVLGLEPLNDDMGLSVEDLLLPEEIRSILDGALRTPPGTGRCLSVYLKGPRQSGRRTLARALATRMGLPLKQCRPFDGPEPGSALLVDVLGNFDHDDWALVQEHSGLAFLRQVNGDSTFDFEGCADLVLDLGDLQVGPMVIFAARKLKEAGPLFAACDPFEVAQAGAAPGKMINAIERLVRESQWRGHSPEVVKRLLIKNLSQTSTNGEASKFADVVTPKLGLKDLCLPAPVMERFTRVIRSIRGRKELLDSWGLDPALVGKAQGICLFHGPSGTGKSLAGEVMAKELGLPLWRMQASELESAYIGESEAKLHRFFEHAKGKPAVLLLDEADSVLADRSRAEGSTRRYIQSLAAAWLRELDQFEGVLILTSNFANNIDPAFERRVQFRVEFPVPDAGVREQIWANLIGNAPIPGRDALDLALVAERFPLAGGLIRNAFLNACHRASEIGHITQEFLYEAAEEEQKSALPKVGHGQKQIHGFAAGRVGR